MNEAQIRAQINMLANQRDNALNTCVNLAGELAVANDTIEDLKARIGMMELTAQALPDDAPLVA